MGTLTIGYYILAAGVGIVLNSLILSMYLTTPGVISGPGDYFLIGQAFVSIALTLLSFALLYSRPRAARTLITVIQSIGIVAAMMMLGNNASQAIVAVIVTGLFLIALYSPPVNRWIDRRELKLHFRKQQVSAHQAIDDAGADARHSPSGTAAAALTIQPFLGATDDDSTLEQPAARVRSIHDAGSAVIRDVYRGSYYVSLDELEAADEDSERHFSRAS